MEALKRNWCFTLNNYTTEEYENVLLLQEHAKYLVIGKEVGEEGTPHLQGFISFKNARKFNGVKRIFNNDRFHIEACNGTPKQNEVYCKKGGDFVEFGEVPKQQGQRTDLDGVVDMIREKRSLKEIVEEYPGNCIKYIRGIREVHNRMIQNHRDWKTVVYWIHGTTGCGKTRWVHQLTRDLTVYWKDPSTRWWDGYDSQEYVVLDDFRPTKELPFSYLLRLFDRYPMMIEAKGMYIPFLAKVIFVTSPVPMREAFKHLDFLSEGDLEQMIRRVKEVNFNDENLVIRYTQIRIDELVNEN